MKHMVKMLAAAAMAVAAMGAQADPQISWTYSIHTTWQSATFTPGGTIFDTPSLSGNVISWGANGGSYTTQPGGTRSALVLTDSGTPGTPKTGTVFTDNLTPQEVAKVTHYNNPLDGNYQTLSTATLRTVMTLTPLNPAPNPAGSQYGPVNLDFSVNFIETLNAAGTCVIGSSVCDDIFVLTQGSFDQEFTYGGYSYFVSFVPGSGPLTTLPTSACTAAGASAGCLGFWTAENSNETETFGLVITSTPINPAPEPAMLALVGIGLLGAVGASRRRRQQA